MNPKKRIREKEARERKRTLRVCLIGNVKEDASTSMHLYLQELKNHLPKHVKTAVIVPTSSKLLPVRYSRFINKHIQYLFLALRLRKERKKRKIDLCHIVDHSYAHLVPWLGRKRTIVTCHDLIPYTYPPSTTGLGRFLFGWYMRGMRKARAILTVSANTKNDVAKILHYDVERIHVVSEGVDTNFKRLAQGEVGKTRKKYGLEKSKVLLAVGGAPYKNIDGVLLCFAKLARKDRMIKLIKMVGGFTEEQKTFLKNQELDRRVVVPGYVSDAEMVRIYNAADCLVFPSFYEGFGRPVLEAMACGCPVVTSNRASLPEVAGDAAILIDPKNQKALNDAVWKVLRNASTRRGMIKKGLIRARAFRWKSVIGKTVKAYEESLP